MYINCYKSDETNFEHNGSFKVFVDEEENNIYRSVNNQFYTTFKVSSNDLFIDYLEPRMIVKIPTPNKNSRYQLFRIMDLADDGNGIVFTAFHIAWDLSTGFLPHINIVGKARGDACKYILDKAQETKPHRFTINEIDVATELKTLQVVRYNPLVALMGKEDNTVLSRYGDTEFDFDNFNIHVYNKLGTRTGYLIKDNKNLISYSKDLDYKPIATRIIPQGADELLLPEYYIDSPLIKNYDEIFYKHVEFPDIKINEEEGIDRNKAIELLREAAQNMFSQNNLDKPVLSWNISFDAMLNNNKIPTNLKRLLKLDIGDTVLVSKKNMFNRLESRILEYNFNFVKNEYKDITISSQEQHFTVNIDKTVSDLKFKIDNFTSIIKNLDETLSTKIEQTEREILIEANSIIDNAKDEIYKNAEKDKEEINKNIEDVQGNVKDLKDYTEGALTDNLLTEDEKSKISGFLKPLETELADITKEYNTTYSNVDLTGVYKTNLKNAYDSYKLKYDGLITIINALLQLTVITEENKLALDIAYTEHDNMLANYRQRVNQAIDSIADRKANSALEGAKTHTNAQIKVVSDEIEQKVSQTDYDENNNVVSEKFAQMEHTVDGWEFKVSQTGAENLIKNSCFKKLTSHWAEHGYYADRLYGRGIWVDLSGEWVIPNYPALVIHGSGSSGEGFEYGLCQNVAVKKNTEYTFTCLVAAHRAKARVIIRNSSGGWLTAESDYSAQGGQDPNKWAKVNIKFNSGDNTTIRIDLVMHSADSDPYVWFTQTMLNEGTIAGLYRSHSSEIYGNTIIIDIEAIKALHSNGDFSQMSNQGFKRHRGNGDLQGDYHYLMHQGTIYCNSEQYVRVYLPSDFHYKKVNAVAAAACIGTGTDAWDKPEPLVSFWAEVNSIASDSSWVEFYASTRQNRNGSILTQHKGIKFAYWITA